MELLKVRVKISLYLYLIKAFRTQKNMETVNCDVKEFLCLAGKLELS